MALDEKARDFKKLHPTHNGGPWDGWCAALMARMCIAYGDGPIPIPASAKIAAGLAGKLNPDASKAPIGAFHYWQYGVDGHVGLDTKGGGKSVFMASSYLKESLGNGLGFQSVTGYTRNGAFPYLGWSMIYGKNGKITQETVVTKPTAPPVAVSTVSIAEQKLIDLKIIDPGHDSDGIVSWNAMEWSLYRLLQALGKA